MNNHVTPFSYLAAALLLGMGAITRKGAPTDAYDDDNSITNSLRALLQDNRAVNAECIGVATVNGTVMLSGSTASKIEKSMAEALAWKVPGVKTVRNEIAVHSNTVAIQPMR
jgi:osmotically-inducible protein OsmY